MIYTHISGPYFTFISEQDSTDENLCQMQE